MRTGEPLLLVSEWDVPRRADSPDVLKAHGLWAEHACEAPMEQWTVANECFAAALDDPDEALGRRWTGIIVLLFLAWHLADFTWGWVNPDYVRGAVYRNLDASLSRLPVAALYVVANIALGIHLFHGVWSLFQSMGWNSPRFNAWRRAIAAGIATAIVVGNVSFPIAVQAGIIEIAS